MAGGAARRAGARFSRILKMTAWGMDFCHGLGLLVQVIYIYICLKKFGFIFPPGYLSK